MYCLENEKMDIKDLRFEIESAIDCVVLQSTAQVDLVDIDSNVTIVSKTPVNEMSKSSKVLARGSTDRPEERAVECQEDP